MKYSILFFCAFLLPAQLRVKRRFKKKEEKKTRKKQKTNKNKKAKKGKINVINYVKHANTLSADTSSLWRKFPKRLRLLVVKPGAFVVAAVLYQLVCFVPTIKY